MRKTELYDTVAKRTGYQPSVVREIVGAILTTITDELRKGNDVTLTGFGTFSTTTYQARKVNGIAGETVKVPKHRVVKFRTGKYLRDAVRRVKK